MKKRERKKCIICLQEKHGIKYWQEEKRKQKKEKINNAKWRPGVAKYDRKKSEQSCLFTLLTVCFLTLSPNYRFLILLCKVKSKNIL